MIYLITTHIALPNPHHTERTVLLSGPMKAVMDAQELVLRRIQQDPWTRGASYGSSSSDQILVRIIVPAAAAGAIIGRHGCNINALKDDTGAHIKVRRSAARLTPSCLPPRCFSCVFHRACSIFNTSWCPR